MMVALGHDERDFDFAKKYNIPIKRVLIMSQDANPEDELEAAECDLGWMVNSGLEGFDGLYGDDAKAAVCRTLESKGSGNGTVNWKIRPWLIADKDTGGTPIPIIHCNSCGAASVPEEQLPVELPRDVVFDGKGNPLETSESFCNVDCPKCGSHAKRETDTMDTFVDSSWYFLRYTDSMQNESSFNEDVANHWMNVDFYCGGIEHAQMHLIYARFWTKALRDIGLHDIDEPFNELLARNGKQICTWCNSCAITLHVDYSDQGCPHCDEPLSIRSAKMSKSLGNTVSPEEMIEKYGADTVRLFILFAANPTAGMDWSDAALEANYRQMVQLYGMPNSILEWKGQASDIDVWMKARLKQRFGQWKNAMDNYDLRGAVDASHFDLVKDLNWAFRRRGGENPEVGKEILNLWCHMISVATPHLAEDWWKMMGNEDLIAARTFPHPDEISAEEISALEGEAYLRSFLEQARKVAKAAKHIGRPNKCNHSHKQTMEEKFGNRWNYSR